MVTFGGLNFATDIGVLLELRSLRGHTTVQETQNALEHSTLDDILDVLRIGYNRAYKSALSEDDFAQVLADNQFGMVRLSQAYEKVVTELMFNGLSPEEIEQRKKALTDLMK